VRKLAPAADGARLALALPAGFECAVGESVAVSGACLTVASRERGLARFDLSRETLERTWFRALAPGRLVNLERALALGDRLGGHFVTGHVDGGGTIVALARGGALGATLTVEVDAPLERYLIDKGSVALDGVSLTVVNPRGRAFDVALIPLTLERTSLARARPGDRVNVEGDLLGKWVEKLLGR
jgi:riboflavin synthase